MKVLIACEESQEVIAGRIVNSTKECSLPTERKTGQKPSPALQKLWLSNGDEKITPPTIKIGGITISKTLLAVARSLIPKTNVEPVSPGSLSPWHNRGAVQIPQQDIVFTRASLLSRFLNLNLPISNWCLSSAMRLS